MTDYDGTTPIVTTAIIGGQSCLQGDLNAAPCCSKTWSQNHDTATNPPPCPAPVVTGFISERSMPYMKNTQIWICPSMGGNFDASSTDNSSYLSSHCITNQVGAQHLNEAQYKISPAQVTIWQDAVEWYNTTGCANMWRGLPVCGDGSSNMAGSATAHGQGGTAIINVGFLDGHVKSMPIMEWSTIVNQANTWR